MKLSHFASGLIVVLTIAGSAFAGQKDSTPVTISGNWAWGQSGSARASADSQQNIGCEIRVNGSGGLLGGCSATNSSGTNVGCSIASAQISAYAQVLGMQTADSYYQFSWDGSGVCSYLIVYNNSANLPLTP